MSTGPRPIPLRALPLALAALAIPGLGAAFVPELLQDDAGLLLWITPILPAFLLAFYRGWRGAALALAFGMASLATANAVMLLTGIAPPGWPALLALVVVYLILTLGVAGLTELLEHERRSAERLAFTDALTQLPNRREADRALTRFVEAARRGQTLSLVIFDLDRFKSVNDVHGHAAGDLVLQELGRVLREETRGMDLSARFGGEEFVTLLPGTTAEEAVRFAERVRARTAALEMPCGPVTLSAGVAGFSSDTDSQELLLAAADRALYAAKDAGRDRVRSWRAEGSPDAESPATPSADARLRVLVVDDDRALELALTRSLQRLGFEALAGGGARGALRSVQEDGGIDVLLTDVVMPEMSGPTLVEQLRRRGFHPAVVYMSGHLEGDVRSRLLPGGRGDFVQKPIELEPLTGLLQRVGSHPRSLKAS